MRTKLNIRGRSIADKLPMARRIFTAISDNPAFASLLPMLPNLNALTDAMQSTSLDAQLARQSAIEKTVLQVRAEAAWDAYFALLAAAVEQVSASDPATIVASGFDIRSEPLPIGQIVAPTELKVSVNGHAGQVNLRWKRGRGAKTFELQCSMDPNSPAEWSYKTSTTNTRVTVKELTSGERCWLRVRGIGTAGPGLWSNPVVITVP